MLQYYGFKEIGSGTYGTVYKATDSQTGEMQRDDVHLDSP